MVSAYKSVTRPQEDSDEDVFLGVEESGDSSSTVRSESTSTSDSDAEYTTETSTKLPLELNNRILMLTSRGVSSRHRHLLNDLHALLPHTYKDTKLDTKSSNNFNSALNGLADLHSCNHILFLEARKRGQDLYLWLANAPNGPTVKFSVTNIHTMAEIGFGGNCLKGGRGLVVFDKSFEDGIKGGTEYKSLLREMFRSVFCIPSKGVRGMKPFVDRIIGVYGLDGKIWIRVYEVREAEKHQEGHKSHTEISLVEIGPRFVMTPILILEGSFGGAVIYQNKEYVSNNQIRHEKRRKPVDKYVRRKNDAVQLNLKKKVLASTHSEKRSSLLTNGELFRN